LKGERETKFIDEKRRAIYTRNIKNIREK
jgi:hypothetical protein